MNIFVKFNADYKDILQVDGAFSVSHINYEKSPLFNGADSNNLAIHSRKESISSKKRIENVLEELLLFNGTEKNYSKEDRIQIWEKYWLEYINAFDKMIINMPNSIVTSYIGRKTIELGFKYLLLKKTNQIIDEHDLGKLADILFSEYSINDDYMEYVDVFCKNYCRYVEGGHVEYFGEPEYEGNTFFAGNRLDISWLSYNMVLIILKLLHFADLETKFNIKNVYVIINNLYNLDSSKETQKVFTFFYNEDYSIKDLYVFLISELVGNYRISLDSLALRFHIVKDGKRRFYRLDYNLDSFIENHSVDGILKLSYTMGIPGGMGASIFELANIRVNPDERNHKYIPHVHISPYNKQSPVIRIELNNLTQMKGDSVKFENVFNKKQCSDILELLRTNQIELINYYKRIQDGEYIPHFLLTFKGDKYEFK